MARKSNHFEHLLPGEFKQAELYRYWRDRGDIQFAQRLSVIKARNCLCGSIHCPLCGFRKFSNRVSHIETTHINGYMAGGLK